MLGWDRGEIISLAHSMYQSHVLMASAAGDATTEATNAMVDDDGDGTTRSYTAVFVVLGAVVALLLGVVAYGWCRE